MLHKLVQDTQDRWRTYNHRADNGVDVPSKIGSQTTRVQGNANKLVLLIMFCHFVRHDDFTLCSVTI